MHDEPLPIVPIEYANPQNLPQRPGILTAVAVGDFAIALITALVNIAAIVMCVVLYRLTLPPPPPVPVLPLAPTVALTPYHGDYLPTDGLPRENRSVILSALDHKPGMNPDRRAMLDRLLAECGKQMLPANASAASFTGAVASSSPKSNLRFDLPTGSVQIGNSLANFSPADGSADTVIHDNIVTHNGRSQFAAVSIDETVDQVQHHLDGAMNALQAAALAELDRPHNSPSKYADSFETPPIYEISKVDGCSTILFNELNGPGGWILTTGAVVTNPYGSPVALDPVTGMQRVPPPPPVPTRKPLTLEHWVIFASAAEYLASGGLAILLVVAGIRLLNNAGDAPRLHGAYILLKFATAIVNFILGLQSNQQLVDGGFLPEVKWFALGFGLILQTWYAVTLLIVFTREPVRDFYRRLGMEASVLPISWQKQAARFSPDGWNRPQAILALLVGLAILAANYFLWSQSSGGELGRSYLFYASALSGVILVFGSFAGLFRRRTAITIALILCGFARPLSSRADDAPSSTPQLIDQARAEHDINKKGALLRKLEKVDDAFIPLLQLASQPKASNDRLLANHSLQNWCRFHSVPDTPEAKAAVQDALPGLLEKIHAVPYGNDGDDAALVAHIADTATLVPAVEPWLHHRGDPGANSAMELIGDAKPDNDQKWKALVACVDDPYTRQFAAQLLTRYRAPDLMDRLGDMAQHNPNVASRQVAIGCLENSFRGNWLTPAVESAVRACLKDSDTFMRSRATLMLCQMVRGGEIKTAAELKSPKLDEREAAADALAMDPYDYRTVPVILPMMQDKDPAVRAAALKALNRSQFSNPDAIPVTELLQALDDPDPQVRFQAASVIRYCEPAAAAMGPHTYTQCSVALLEGTNNGRDYTKLTDRPPTRIAPAVDTSIPNYTEVDPLTGLAIVPAANPPAMSVSHVLATFAWWTSAVGWPVLICVVVGAIARSRLPRE